MSAWISVKDGMPENGVEVLVCALDKEHKGMMPFMMVAKTTSDFGPMEWTIGEGASGCDAELNCGEITHWQPLPEWPE